MLALTLAVLLDVQFFVKTAGVGFFPQAFLIVVYGYLIFLGEHCLSCADLRCCQWACV